MARISLVTGGCRSGKSAYAQQVAEQSPPPRTYVATAVAIDEEMRERIASHQQARRNRGWETVEEPLELAAALARCRQHKVVLIDCLTIWINNLMYDAEQNARQVTETDVVQRCRELLAAAGDCRDEVILVTNEVGLGVVPENRVARRYRDLVGRANQVIAAQADSVTLVACGIPWQLKGAQRS